MRCYVHGNQIVLTRQELQPDNPIQNAASVLSYGHDWSTWLGSETIASSSWAADAGITIDSDSNSTTATSVFLSGGTAGVLHPV